MITLLTDSASDISKELAQTLNIQVLPLFIHFEEQAFVDGVDIDKTQFYQMLSSSAQLPTTSQINPAAFEQAFQAEIDAGNEVVALLLSSHLSGTFQSAAIAREAVCPQKIHLIDTKSATFGIVLLAREAAAMRDAGASAAQIVSRITALSARLRIVAFVETLKYLHMGGRLSSSSMFVANLLGICPMVAIENGKVLSIGKVRGLKSALQFMHKRLKEDAPDPAFPIAFAHANAPAALAEAVAFMSAKLGTNDFFTGEIGSIVGTYTGPGALGMVYLAKE